MEADPYIAFDRATWAALRAATPLTLTDGELDGLRGLRQLRAAWPVRPQRRIAPADPEAVNVRPLLLLNLLASVGNPTCTTPACRTC